MSLEKTDKFKAQVDHIREWATRNIQLGDALASGMMRSHFSTVFFGPERRLRFAGTVPFGDPTRHYHFYFFPGGDTPAIFATEMIGNLRRSPFKITMPLPEDKGFSPGGTIVLQRQDKGGIAYVVASPNFEFGGNTYDGNYYLLTLGPSGASSVARSSSLSISSEDEVEEAIRPFERIIQVLRGSNVRSAQPNLISVT